MKQVNMNTDLINTILVTLESQLSELHSLLKKEKELLADSDFDNIAEIAEQKKQLITSIELDDAKFKTLLSNSESVNNTDTSIHEIILKDFPNSLHLWVEIENLLKICKDKNSINGIILANNRRQIQQRLAILQGQSNEVLTYGASGESVATNSPTNSPLSV